MNYLYRAPALGRERFERNVFAQLVGRQDNPKTARYAWQHLRCVYSLSHDELEAIVERGLAGDWPPLVKE